MDNRRYLKQLEKTGLNVEIIKAQIRRHKDGELYLFMYNHSIGNSWLECFCFSEGHSECVDGWRLRHCKPVSLKDAKTFALNVQNYYNTLPMTKCIIHLVYKLNRLQNRN